MDQSELKAGKWTNQNYWTGSGEYKIYLLQFIPSLPFQKTLVCSCVVLRSSIMTDSSFDTVSEEESENVIYCSQDERVKSVVSRLKRPASVLYVPPSSPPTPPPFSSQASKIRKTGDQSGINWFQQHSNVNVSLEFFFRVVFVLYWVVFICFRLQLKLPTVRRLCRRHQHPTQVSYTNPISLIFIVPVLSLYKVRKV